MIRVKEIFALGVDINYFYGEHDQKSLLMEIINQDFKYNQKLSLYNCLKGKKS